MKKTIQTKRNKPSGSSYRVLYAKTGRKRRLHAATATADPGVELESDVPNIGIGRALLVILVLHILAIAAIYIHSTFFGNNEGDTANKGQPTPSETTVAAVAPAAKEVPAPEAAAIEPAEPSAAIESNPAAMDPQSERYIVVTGDTYSRIAGVRNVDEQALRALNSNRPLRAGVVLDLPAQLSSRPVDPTPAPAVAVIDGDESPKLAPEASVDNSKVSEHDVSDAPKAVVVKPNRPAPAVATDVKDSGVRYTIKSGDTLWRISNRYKVSREALLKLNGIKDANKLYAGRTIKIPAK
ncbi:MAG: LysM peptidoglycan-binding domain-containing protein [Verrucomicrobiae bacterium]|nr:LysM peptidoglycan-binding domain-containing protein [Verrucomicrobiae bacterium]NNJ86316.1 LysM peptidoglycan-binding domain-containing protein [Akkermansiaceae bacterium]